MKYIYRLLTVAVLLMALMVSGCDSSDGGSTTTDQEKQPNVSDTNKDIEEDNTDTEKEAVIEDKGDENTEAEIVEPEPVEPAFGGTLNIASFAPRSLNPIENDRQSVHQVLGMVYESLFTLDSTLKPVPTLVESYTFEDNGSVLNIKLKEGVVFHDGTPLTTADVVYSVEAIQESDFTSYGRNVIAIKRMTVVDELNLTIDYDQGYAFALSDLTFPIISSVYTESEAYDELVPVGTGPYRYTDYQQMQHLDLAANLDWHGGTVYVEKIHCVIIDDDSSYETLFDQHLIDVMNPSRFNWLKYSENEKHQIDGYTSSYYDFIGFNFETELFEDVAVRQAFAFAVNREFILYDRFVNHGVLVNSPVIPGSWFSTDSEPVYTYDMDRAKSMLPDTLIDKDEDGYYDQQDLLDENTYTTIELKLLVNASNPLRADMAAYVQKDLEALGFMVTVEAEMPEVYYERVQNGDFDLLYGGWKLSQVPDYSALFSSFGKQNYIGYESDVMDQALNKIIDSYTEEQIISSVDKFEEVMTEEVPYISMYFLEGAVMRHREVYGEFQATTESMFGGIEAIYLDK